MKFSVLRGVVHTKLVRIESLGGQQLIEVRLGSRQVILKDVQVYLLSARRTISEMSY